MKTPSHLLITLIVASLAFFSGCGKKGGLSPGNMRNYTGSSAPGDTWYWTWDVAARTFSARRDVLGTPGTESDDAKASGSLEYLSSGFYKLSVISTNDPTRMPKDLVMFALEVPGTALFIRPAVSAGHLITAVAAGNCSDSNGSYAWIKTGFSATTSNLYANEAFGTLDLSADGSKMNLVGYGLGNGTVFSNIFSGLCSKGQTVFNQMVLQSGGLNGTLAMDLGPTAGGIFGVKSSPIKTSDLLGKTYLGILSSFRSTGDDSSAVRFQMNTTLGTGYPFQDLPGAVLNTAISYSLQIDSMQGNRVFATLSTGSYSRVLRGIAFQNNGVTGIFLVGQEFNGASPMNLLLVSQL